ncbi:hypothetical protein [Porphyromonas endodontalis]
MNEYGFRRGYSQVRQKDAKKVMEQIKKTLGITTNVSWNARLNGKVEPKMSEAKAIEKVFAEYGITEVWGSEV